MNLLPKETKVIILKGFNKGKTAVIKDYTFQKGEFGFLHYLGEIQGRKGLFCLLADEIEVIK